MRTEQEIVDAANSLARDFYRMMGYGVQEGYRFDRARHPQERLCWAMAKRAFEVAADTDVDECMNLIEE